MIKIYHLHEKISDYEEYVDRIIESSFDKNLLEEKKKELENKFYRDKDCNECPLYFCSNDCDEDCDKCNSLKITNINNFCKTYEPFDDEPTSCKNFSIGNDRNYFIEEQGIEISKEELLKLIY